MKNIILKTLFVAAITVVILTWRQPIISIIEKRIINKELKEKINLKDSLEQIVQRVKNNTEEKRKEARKMGYSKNEETMLKIINPNTKKENDKVITNAVLSISAVVIFFLVIILAALSKKKSEPKSESESESEPEPESEK